jgi:predicted RNase H-like HicB family nuclease
MMHMHEFDVVIIEDETGGYVSLVPALPGCHTQGDTLEELSNNTKEAINLYRETLNKEEKKRPSPTESGWNTESEGACA